jgi:hypothetical protein
VYVKNLLLAGYKAWDNTKIRNLFTSSYVNAVFEVSLFASVHENKLVWENDKNGGLFCQI